MNKLVMFPLMVMLASFFILSQYSPAMLDNGSHDVGEGELEEYGWEINLGVLGSIHIGLGLFSFGTFTIDFTSFWGIMAMLGGVGMVVALFGIKVGASGTTNTKALAIALVLPAVWIMMAGALGGYFYSLGELGETLLWGLTLMYGIGTLIEIVGSADSGGMS